jgi:GNAT superfamily N-acetyltransferase
MEATYKIRSFIPEDREAINALGSFVLGWWHERGASLHQVVIEQESGDVVAHLQAKDRSVPKPSRHTERCDLLLTVAASSRRQGIGTALLAEAEAFARERGLRLLYASAREGTPGIAFLEHHAFVEVERYFPSQLDVATFDPEPFGATVGRVAKAGIRFLTYADIPDTPENRHRVYDLHQAVQRDQPFRMVGPYIPEPFEEWEKGFSSWDKSLLFLAKSPDNALVGMVIGLSWNFTGVHPDWRGRGIATALKLRMIEEARRRGLTEIATENHEDNAAMLAVNRKLGFRFETPEIGLIKHLMTEVSQ